MHCHQSMRGSSNAKHKFFSYVLTVHLCRDTPPLFEYPDVRSPLIWLRLQQTGRPDVQHA
jgi:hypothetical protein